MDGTLSYIEETVITRAWYEKQYYFPISAPEVEKAPALVLNFGY